MIREPARYPNEPDSILIRRAASAPLLSTWSSALTLYNKLVLVSDFDYDLPKQRIAQTPLADRSASRMLVVDRTSGTWQDRGFRDFPGYLQNGDRLVVNNSRVLPARVFGRREGVHTTTSKKDTRGLVELMLLKQVNRDPVHWEALVRPGRKIRVGEVIHFPGDVSARILSRGEFGLRVVEFSAPAEDFLRWLDATGHMPLPPYIKRSDDLADRERYQTVYATRTGSVAAPTAGLHFTEGVLSQLEQRHVQKVEVTLHVGLGTFQPVRVEQAEDHSMHAESYEISAEAAEQLDTAGRIVAIGTTTVRVLEHARRSAASGRFEAGAGETNLFILPGYEFQAVDALLTNFHLPRSTLLMLVCAFAGRELTLSAYAHAVRENYRFYSYGDCMLVV